MSAKHKETLKVSRGPGYIERAIEQAFCDNPSATFSTNELVIVAYSTIRATCTADVTLDDGATWTVNTLRASKIKKKHTVAVLRAAHKIARRMHWEFVKTSRPHGRGASYIIFFNRLDLRSYAISRMRFFNPWPELDRPDDDLSGTKK
jgi:hypothetical protein